MVYLVAESEGENKVGVCIYDSCEPNYLNKADEVVISALDLIEP